jgi:hypothetical protein
MANAFSRAFIKPLKKRVKPFLQANEISFALMQRDLFRYFSCMRKLCHLYTQYGFMPYEAQRFGLLKLEKYSGERFISKKRMVAQQKMINPQHFMELTEDKAIFSLFCKKNHIPIPKLLGLFFSNSVGMNCNDSKPLNGSKQWIDFFVNHCPDHFVVKPSRGVYGAGIIFVDKNKEEFSGARIYQQLMQSQYDAFVIQETLKNHSSILAINPKEGLQTLRVTTFIDENLNVKVLYAFFKIIVGNNRVDNHRGGRLGNLLSEIDLLDGSLKLPVLMTEEGLVEVPNHPETGKYLAGITMPLWQDAFSLAKGIAPHFLPMRSIGWDIALTPDGARIIEGNARWDPPSFGNFGEKELQVFGDMNILKQS